VTEALLAEIARPVPEADVTASGELYTRVAWRIVPVMFCCYVLAYLDRINIGYAQLQMKADLGFSDAVYGLGAGIFFLGYFLFEVPSNLLLVKVGARKTITRIMVVWGLVSAAMAFIQTPWMFYGMRFLLGMFEAGFFPGAILYLTFWFPGAYRGRMIALFASATAIAGLIGGPLSGWIMNDLAGAMGLRGWQWMFIIEGLPATAIGVFVFCYLDDRPGDAKWLTPGEKALIEQHLRAEQGPAAADGAAADGAAAHGLASLWTTMRDPTIYMLAFSWFAFICGIYMISFWLPTIIKEMGVANPLHVGLLAAIPYGIAIAATIAIGLHSDRTLERRWHCALPALCTTAGLIGLTFSGGHVILSFAFLSLAAIGTTTVVPLFWSIPTAYLKGANAAAGIALINTLGLIGGFLSPFVLGIIKTSTGSLDWGNWLMAGMMAVGALVILTQVRPGMLREAGRGVPS